MPTAPAPACPWPRCPHRRPCPVHTAEAQRVNQDVRRWYRLARWRHPVWGRRAVALRRHPFCVDCGNRGRVRPSTEVDHVIPHRGDPRLFWDEDNLQGLCHECHGAKTVAEQQRGDSGAAGARGA